MKNQQNMENIIIKCINGNHCLDICNVKNCQSTPFLCNNQQCKCYEAHNNCATNIRWKKLKQILELKVNKSSTQQVKQYFNQVVDSYNSVFKKIELSFVNVKNIFDTFGLSQFQREVYTKLKQRRFFELNGSLISKIDLESPVQQKQFLIQSIEKQKQEIKQQIENIIKMLEYLVTFRQQGVQNKISIIYNTPNSFSILKSKVTQDEDTILHFFPINHMKLLYRASQHNFQASRFWDKCDGKQNTFTILKTQFGKIIGGFTPLAWNKKLANSNCNQIDNSNESFIFSLTNKHQFRLIAGKQQFAIFHRNNYGPVFGGGTDLWISDRANQNANSGAYNGHTYNNIEYTYDHQQSYKKFSGQANKFKIEEWQVHQIIFS